VAYDLVSLLSWSSQVSGQQGSEPTDGAAPKQRIGGDIVVETLRALGADTVSAAGSTRFGCSSAAPGPGHPVVSSRVEKNLAFAADGMPGRGWTRRRVGRSRSPR